LKCLTQQSTDILKHESLRAQLAHGADGLRKHVSCVVVSPRFPSDGKRLAGGAACHEINRAKISEAYFSDIRFDDIPPRAIESECSAGIPIALNERNLLETRGFEAERKTASTGE